ncbi:TRAP transporter small permease [Modicisalibacter coralii]|uniref:TRAP transporter small permease n=1 Tax=Modicisalibacter coralii TaxID=2304602 RepID=UPI001396BD6B|nr:TRAP transporter small permease [Halomonas coralii]
MLLRWTDKLATSTEWIAATILAVIIIINFAAVAARYLLDDPFGWSEEAMRYGIVWAVYLVAGATFRRGEQMAIDLIDLVPSRRFRVAASIVSLASTLLLAAIVVVLGLPYLLDTGQVSPSMRIPMWIPYASVVVGYVLIALQAVAAFIDPPDSTLEEVAK